MFSSMFRWLIVLSFLCATFQNAAAMFPSNDSFANAHVLVGPSGIILDHTEGSTLEPGEEVLDAYAEGSLWYQWTPPTNGTYYFKVTCGSVCRQEPPIYTGTAISNLVRMPVLDGGLLASTGVVYRIQIVALIPWGPTPFALTWSFASPRNDDFFAAQSVTTQTVATAWSGSITGSNLGATWQFGEPEFNTGHRSVWYLWRAPFSGIATFDTLGSSFNTLLAIYTQRPKYVFTADSIGNLELVALSDDIDPQTNLQTRVSFSAEGGHKYWIVVDGTGGAEGNIVLTWNLIHDGRLPDMIVGPFLPSLGTGTFEPNDCVIGHQCATVGTRRLLSFGTLAINIGNADLFPGGIPGLQFEYHQCHGHSHLLGFAEYRLVTNGGSTVVTGQKASFCLQDSGRHDTNASEHARYYCNSSLGTGQGIQAGWADYYWPGLPCQWLDVTGVPPGVYTLEVEIDPDNQFPELNDANNTQRVLITLPPEPYTHLNDNFETAYPIRESNSWHGEWLFVQNAGATREPSEPIIGDGRTVWFRWTAPSNGPVTLDTVGPRSFPTFNTVLAVFIGEHVTNLTLVAMNDDINPSNRNSRVRFIAQAGTVYHIAIDGAADQNGHCTFNWWFGPAPMDNLGDLEPPEWNIGLDNTWSNVNATKQPGEPNHAGNAGGHSVWRSITAEMSRRITVTTAGSNFDTLLAIYTGPNVSNLTLIASNDNFGTNRTSTVEFCATADVTYHVAIDGKDGDCGRVAVEYRYEQIDPFFETIRLAHGGVELTLTADDDEPFSIQTSSNLITWSELTRSRTDRGTLRVLDTTITNSHHRFYRAMALRDD